MLSLIPSNSTTNYNDKDNNLKLLAAARRKELTTQHSFLQPAGGGEDDLLSPSRNPSRYQSVSRTHSVFSRLSDLADQIRKNFKLLYKLCLFVIMLFKNV